MLRFDEDDGEVNIEDFEVRTGEGQVNCKFVSTTGRKEDDRMEHPDRRGAPTDFKLLGPEMSGTGPGKMLDQSNLSRDEEELRGRERLPLSKDRPSELEAYPGENSSSPGGGLASQ